MGTRAYIHTYPGEDPGATITYSDSKEPAVKIGASVAGVIAIIGIVNDVFVPDLLTNSGDSVLYAILALMAPVATSILTRKFVWSPASVKTLIEDLLKTVPKK